MALKAKRLEEIIKILNIDKEKKTKTKKKRTESWGLERSERW